MAAVDTPGGTANGVPLWQVDSDPFADYPAFRLMQMFCSSALFRRAELAGAVLLKGFSMRTNFVLVDFENVQPTPEDIGLLKDGPFKVKLFIGPTRKTVSAAFAAALQPLGGDAEYVPLETAGSNAVDFQIAYYLGVLATGDANACFHIISNDLGFDPLIKHLKGRSVWAWRSASIPEIPYFQRNLPSTSEAQIEIAVADLIRRKASRPRTQKALLGTLRALFRNELSEEQVAQLVASLCSRGVVKIDGTIVSYSLPIEA